MANCDDSDIITAEVLGKRGSAAFQQHKADLGHSAKAADWLFVYNQYYEACSCVQIIKLNLVLLHILQFEAKYLLAKDATT